MIYTMIRINVQHTHTYRIQLGLCGVDLQQCDGKAAMVFCLKPSIAVHAFV